MKRPPKSTYYIVYPPDYVPFESKYYKVRTKTEALKIAKGLGEGSELHMNVHKYQRNGWGSMSTPCLYDWKGKKYWCMRKNHWYWTLKKKSDAAKENLERSLNVNS